MKSVLEASLIACLLAFGAGCSSADDSADTQTNSSQPPSSQGPGFEAPAGDGTSALLSQSLTAPPTGTSNPCAAASCLTGTSCEVVDGQAVCTPLEPSGPFCGGFAGIACPGSGTCVDAPGDGCDPENGGADCGGICECNIRALCVRGSVFDSSPEVCACVPREPEPDACSRVRCRAGTHCEVVNDRATCAPDAPNPCAAVLCPAPSSCDVVDGQAVCTPIEPPNPCAAVLCPAPSSCDVVDGQAVCTPIAPSGPFCGGFAGIACPGSGTCADVPGDGCDPENGGADCGGACTCLIRALCIRGLVFDPSPEVCACVPREPDPCAAVRCRGGTHCEVVDDGAICAPDEPVNPCAAVLCPAPSTCDVVDGKAVCTPIEPSGPFCGGIAAFRCPGAGSCVDNPNDDCDPERGGADCGGICECNIRALCIEGFVFDPSAEVCACVPAGGGSGPMCSADAE